MTVSYQYDVASSASGGFIRLLFRWKGSVWKVVYREMLIFTVCYIMLTVLYNFLLTDGQQKIFEKVVYFCATFMDLIPLSFMLGFYVSFIAARWWSQFIAIPWPDKLMNIVAMYIPGLDESSRVVRRTLMRYLNLSLVLVLRSISMAVKRRFPTKEHLIEAGFMTKTELEMFQSVPSTEFNTFWIPCTWFINVLREARQECRITDSNGLKLIMEELNEFRSKCGLLWGYDWISIPLVYTQVVTMATYAFYVACMFGRQNVNIISDKPSSPEVHRYDFYIPIFTVLQLMFYMGLLKVAEQLINPFGDDDEDFELNWIIDRHMKVSYLGVDTLNGTPPPLVRDTYYDELDVKIPYTEASKGYKKKTYRGSVAYMQVPMEQQGMVLPDMSEEEDDGETMIDSMGHRRPSVYSLFQSKSKGVSPATSFSNLDNRSISSIDSDWKRSLPDLSSMGVKNASGTLGYSQDPPPTVDMATAEDDEIVLQEVIVEQNNISPPRVARSDSLQIPGVTVGTSSEKKTSRFSRLRSLSPKIAPKFPREKLKSMFRKRKLSSAMLFHKLKGVRFSRDTKEEDESENESLLNVEHDQLEVSITLSSPELTELEKETGVHPYYFTQQALISGKQLVMNRAFTVRQASLTRSESEEDNLARRLNVAKRIPRSSSLPNIQQSDSRDVCVSDPIIAKALKKISKVKKPKGTAHKLKKKKKSPPPESRRDSDDTHLHTDPQDLEGTSDNDLTTRRNTLPQIMLTRCDRKVPEHLDLALSPTHSSQSSSQSSDSGAKGSTTSVTSKSRTKTESSPQDKKLCKKLNDKSSPGKPSEFHSKQAKDTSIPSKLKTTPSKEEMKTLQKSQEQPPKLPPRMPISGIKATSDKINVSGEGEESHSLPKKVPPPQIKSEASKVSKDIAKPPKTMTLKKGSSQTIGPVPISEVMDKKGVLEKVPELHSKSSTTPSKPVTFETTTWKEEAAKKSQLRRKSPPPFKRTSPPPSKRTSPPPSKRTSPPPSKRTSPPPTKNTSPPPPKRPETLLLAAKAPDLLRKRGSISAKKIAGIQLATTIPPSPPQSPSTDIPSPSSKGQIPTFPKPVLKPSEPHSSAATHSPVILSPSKEVKSISFPRPAIKSSPKQSPTSESSTSLAEGAKADTVVTIYDSKEDLQGIQIEKGQDSARPPDAPKRHLPRQSSRVKK